MCTVSMVGDFYKDKWKSPLWPNPNPWADTFPVIPQVPVNPIPVYPVPLTNEEIVKRAIDLTKKVAELESEVKDKEQLAMQKRFMDFYEEFKILQKEVIEMKELLKRAKMYDEQNNQPDCEVEDKMDLLRRVAEAVGISLDDVIGKK